MAKINVISYDDYVSSKSANSSNSSKSTGNVISYNDYIKSNASNNQNYTITTKQDTEQQAKAAYESATKAYKSVLNAKKQVVKDEINNLGINAPKLQLQFSTTPSSTFVKNDNGTTTIKSQYQKNQEQIQENQQKKAQLTNALNNNTKYQTLTQLEQPLNNQRLLAKYNYDVTKEENHDINLFDRTLGVPLRAVKDFLNVGSYNTNDYYVDENGNKMLLPQDYQIRQENVRSSYGDDIFGKLAKFGTDVGYNLTKIGLSAAINTIAPYAGSTIYFTDMGVDNFNQAKQQGYDDKSAALYSVVGVASEMVTEKLLGGFSKLTGGESAVSSTVNKALSKVLKNDTLRSILSNAFSEGLEEFVQEFIENLNKNIVLEKKNLGEAASNTFTMDVLEDAIYSSLVGMGSGGIMGGVNVEINTNNTGVIPSIDNNGNINTTSYANQLQTALENTNNQSKIDNINQTLNYLALNQALGNENIQAKGMNQNIKNLAPTLNEISNIAQQYQTSDNVLPGNGNEVVLPRAKQDTNKTVDTQTNNINNLKQQQLNVIKENNPANDDYHTWIRNINDIKTLSETLQDSDWANENTFNPDLSKQDILNAIETGEITVYSSFPIDQGVFVTPSKMEAESYSGDGKVYSKKVSINDIAWIDPTQGQYAKVDNNIKSKTLGNYAIKNVIDETERTSDTSVAKGNDVLKAEPKQDNSRLSKAEIKELETLQDVYNGGFATVEEEVRIQYLENKRDGLIKYPELKQQVEFKDISKEYTKYKNNIGEFNPKLLNEAKESVPGYRNTKTKEQWLDVAENIGLNFKGTSQELTNYAVQSWFEAQPNNKNSLNRQGKGYVKFSINEWVNAVYKGAGVGDILPRTETNTSVKIETPKTGTYTQAEINNMFQFKDDKGNVIALPDDIGEKLATKTTLSPVEVGNIQNIIDSAYQIDVNGNNLEIVSDYDNNIYTIKATKQGDTYVIDDMVKGVKNALGSVAKSSIDTTTEPTQIEGMTSIKDVLKDYKNTAKETVKNATDTKESKFYKNATETSKFLTEDNRAKLSEVGDLKYYDQVSNEESLAKASKRLKDNGTNEALRWMQQDSKTSNATDVAEGWILLKNYQDAGDFDSMVAVAKKMREMGTAAGQAVQAYNIMARLTPEGMVKYAQSELAEAYEVYAKNKSKSWVDKNASKFDLTAQEVGFIVDTMKQVQNMEDGRAKNVKLGEVQKMLTDKLPPEQGAGIKAWMRISMLFNPKTQIRNVMGNAVITPVNLVGDFFASAADKYIAKKTGVRTTGTTDVKNYLKGFKKGLYESYDDFKRGINTRNIDGNRFELGQAKSFSDKNAIGRTFNKIDKLNSFLLDAGDRGFYEASFTNSINNQLALNNTTKVTQNMIDIATSEALQRTWQDNNNYTKFVLNTRNMLNKVNIKGYGLGDVLIPFAKTPANLTKAIVDYSPAGLVNTLVQAKRLKNSISTGTNTAAQQHQFVQTLGKATAGTMLYVAGYALAKAGIATGKSDDDKDTRDFLKNTLGISSYSIKIGDKSFTYDWAQPIAAPLSIMTNIVNSKNTKGQALLEGITSSLDSAGSILLEQSFVKSINEVLTNNDGVVSGLENAILDLPTRAIPTFMKQITDMTDSTQRQTYEYQQPLKTELNKIKAKIPGLSQTLAPSVDTMGREIQKYGGKNNLFNVFLNPANVNTSNISSAAQEIYDVYKQTGDNTIMPRVAPYYINSKGQKTILNTEERKDFQKVAGNIIETGVNELMKNSNYKSMSYEEKSSTIKNLVDYAYNKARKDVLGMDMSNTYNKVNEWTSKGNSVASYYANKEEVNYSLENPTKYNAIKSMNVSYDDYKKYQEKVNEIKKKYAGTKNASIRKQKVAEYINGLSLSANKKIMLFKMLGNYSIKNYSSTIKEYINKFSLTAKEKQEIYNSLF